MELSELMPLSSHVRRRVAYRHLYSAQALPPKKLDGFREDDLIHTAIEARAFLFPRGVCDSFVECDFRNC